MNTYLDECSGLKGKPVVLFTTYGSGTGNQRCMNYMQSVLTRKGAGQFKRFSVQQFKVNNPEFINAVLKGAGI
jgi:NAD(P)H-dependent FMN reductase